MAAALTGASQVLRARIYANISGNRRQYIDDHGAVSDQEERTQAQRQIGYALLTANVTRRPWGVLR